MPDRDVNDDHAYNKGEKMAIMLWIDSKFDGEKLIKVKLMNKTIVILPDFL